MNNLQSEIEGIHVLMEKKTEKDIQPILQAYKRSLNNVRGEMGSIYMKYSKDGVLNLSSQQRYSILKGLENRLVKMAKELGNIDEEKTTEILKDVYEESFYRTAYTIDKGVSAAIDFSIIKPEFIESAIKTPMEGKMYSDRIWKNKEQMINRLRQEIEKGVTQGDSIDKMGKRIKDEFGRSAYEAKRLVNTEMARVVTQAQQKIYEDSGVVKKIMWSATLDDLTNEEDAFLDGKMWDLDESHPEPPLHPNCRCCLIPVVDGWKPTQRRVNEVDEDGKKQIVDYSTYEKWKDSRIVNNDK